MMSVRHSSSARRALRLLAVLLPLLLFAGAAHAKGDLRVGTCRVDITPISPGLAAAYVRDRLTNRTNAGRVWPAARGPGAGPGIPFTP